MAFGVGVMCTESCCSSEQPGWWHIHAWAQRKSTQPAGVCRIKDTRIKVLGWDKYLQITQLHLSAQLYTCSTSHRRRDELIHGNFSACQPYSVQMIHGICSQVRVTNSKFLNLGKSFTSSTEQNSNIISNFATIPVQVIWSINRDLPPYFCHSEAL